MNRWRVERAGSFSGGYGRGWIAMSTNTGVGEWFPTWLEAMTYACEEAFIEAVAAA